ncbi:MAG TPA: MFS transporter [Candidatus Dormibacteraeota bacterium]|nr:MFS transporter [Candidatus Dormibacteraeota bacterium]
MQSVASPRSRRDLWILFLIRFLRAVAFGLSAVLTGLYLQDRRLSALQIGSVLAFGFAAAAITGLVAAFAQGRIGRRRTLAATGLLMAACGVVMVFATQYWLFVLAGLTGMLGVAGTDTGPFLAVEQAILTEATTAAGRNRAFGRYSLTGSLAAAGGGLLAAFGSDVPRTQALFGLYAAIGLAAALLALFLSPGVEGEARAPAFGNLRPLIGLSALFGIDAFGGGLVARSLLAYWLHLKFGATPAVIGPTFAAMQLLGALCFELAGRLADRIGLINTMVFTHLPSNLLLLAFPLLPNLWWAVGLLIVWSAAQSMDIPARQAYVVSIVRPNERSGAVAVTGLTRGIAGAAGPAITGAAIQGAALGTPFVVAGVTKSLYDIALYLGYRRRRAEHEVRATR